MAANTIAYPNLRAEMSRKNIGIYQLAELLNMNRDTLSRQLSRKTDLSLKTAIEIQQRICPDMDIKVLYEVEKKSEINISP